MTATLLQTTNTYLVGSPDRATLTIANSDQPVFTTVISNLHLPVGIDYHSPSNVLIVSLNFDTGLPLNFIQVRTNDATTNWTTISNMTGEINLACARTTNGGWNVGDLYFNTDQRGQIGRVPDTTNSFTTNWITLADSVVQGLYFDQTGLFSNDLVAATSEGGVWLISSLGQTNKLANIGLELECVLTLPNDTNKYGPWAGKILTGNELDLRLFTIDTNGVVIGWPFPAPAENLNLIPANQDLYAVDAGMQGSTNGRVWKISRNAFTNYVGDILVTHEGNLDGQPKHVIVHWDGTSFVTTDLINTNALNYEQATFAPVSFDSH